jgi:hypothetical protein
MRNIARPEDEIARARVNSHAAGFEGDTPIKHAEPLVLAVVDVKRCLRARRLGDLERARNRGRWSALCRL